MTDDRFDELMRETLGQCAGDYIEAESDWRNPFRFSRRFERKMHRLFRLRGLLDIPRIKLTPKRLIVFSVMICLLAGAALNAGAVRKAILGFYVDEYADRSVFEPAEESDKSVIDNEYGITCDMSGYYVDFEERNIDCIRVCYNDFNSDVKKYVVYYQQVFNEMNNMAWSTDNWKISKEIINGIDALYWEKERMKNSENSSFVIWDKGGFIFSIVGYNVNKDELLEIAGSVKII